MAILPDTILRGTLHGHDLPEECWAVARSIQRVTHLGMDGRMSPTNNTRALLVGALLLIPPALLPAQLPTAAPAATASAALPSITLPPALNRVLRDYEAAWRKGDAAALAALFATDGFVLQGGQAPVRGRAAIQRAYAGQGSAPLQLRALAAATADSLGYIIGAYGYGEPRGDVGKFTLTLRRDRGGRWLIMSDMDNLSVAPNGR